MSRPTKPFNIEFKRSPDEAAEALANRVARDIERALMASPTATLLVPGGRTPVAFLDQLSRQRLDWKNIAVGLTDERQVPTDHSASNTALVRAHLLQNCASAAQFRPLLGAHRPTGQCDPPDVVVLGVGMDGHIASLFPDMTVLDEGDGAVIATRPNPLPAEAPFDRWSWSYSSLARAGSVYVLASGPAKADVIQAIADDSGEPATPLARLAILRGQPIPVVLSL
jgi:6-phosphogluconolactonase